MRKRPPIWQLEYHGKLSAMTTEELLDELIERSGETDTDGVFSRRDAWKFATVTQYLRTAIQDLGTEVQRFYEREAGEDL